MAGIEPKVLGLFETPIVIDTVPDHARLNAAITAAIREKRATDPGVIRSNRLGWQSEVDMMRWGGAAAQAVGRHFIGLCDRLTADIHPAAAAMPPFLWMIDLWANVNPPGASNNYHSHPGAVWSAVYYVEDGYAGSRDAPLGGELVFQDPRMPMTRMLPLDLRYRSPEGKVYQSEHLLRPASGMMVLFPPWLLHAVQPYRGAGERISLAMNATAVRAPGPPK